MCLWRQKTVKRLSTVPRVFDKYYNSNFQWSVCHFLIITYKYMHLSNFIGIYICTLVYVKWRHRLLCKCNLRIRSTVSGSNIFLINMVSNTSKWKIIFPIIYMVSDCHPNY